MSIRCIFCKRDSSDSRSVEHILPESLGGKTLVLPRGIVCDGCNNYMAREVEKPFLENPSIRVLRFEEGILSKKGHIPTIGGIMLDEQRQSTVSVARYPEFPGSLLTQRPLLLSFMGEAILGKDSKIAIPKFDMSMPMPSGAILSRFLGKIALEVVALRLSGHPEGIDYLVDEAQFDVLRDHVRYGKTTNWPCSVRQRYDKDIPLVDEETGKPYEIMNEVDILRTQNDEYYLVLAIFGIEFVINCGGPEIDGYLEWLRRNQYVSPLYVSGI